MLALSEVAIEGLSYLPGSHGLLIATSDEKRLQLWSSTFDTDGLIATAARPVSEGVAPSLPSLDRTIALVTGLRPRAPLLRQFTADGKELRVVPQPHFDLRNLALSPDARRLAFRAATTMGKGTALFVFDLERRLGTAVASVQAGGFAAWSADGRMLAVARSGGFVDVVQPGQGTARTLQQGVIGGTTASSVTWTPDNREILFVRERGGNPELAAVRVDDSGQPEPRSVAGIPSLLGAALAPSGRYIAYVAGVPGRALVWVADFPRLANRVQVSSEGAGFPQWSMRGDEVWFVETGDFIAVPITSSSGELTAGKKRKVFTAPSGLSLVSRVGARLFATIDGKEFWIVDDRNEGEARVTLVQKVDQLVARADR